MVRGRPLLLAWTGINILLHYGHEMTISYGSDILTSQTYKVIPMGEQLQTTQLVFLRVVDEMLHEDYHIHIILLMKTLRHNH